MAGLSIEEIKKLAMKLADIALKQIKEHELTGGEEDKRLKLEIIRGKDSEPRNPKTVCYELADPSPNRVKRSAMRMIGVSTLRRLLRRTMKELSGIEELGEYKESLIKNIERMMEDIYTFEDAYRSKVKKICDAMPSEEIDSALNELSEYVENKVKEYKLEEIVAEPRNIAYFLIALYVISKYNGKA